MGKDYFEDNSKVRNQRLKHTHPPTITNQASAPRTTIISDPGPTHQCNNTISNHQANAAPAQPDSPTYHRRPENTAELKHKTRAPN